MEIIEKPKNCNIPRQIHKHHLQWFEDDQLIIQESEDKSQHSMYKLNTLCEMYVKISTSKTKIMAFKGREPV